MLARLGRCAYTVCTSGAADRNLFEEATVTWNPALRTALEPGAVPRDPTASLLHELVHAADACDGLNAAAHELHAVRIENVYRRAVGLPQRTRYGERALPASMTRACDGVTCSCATPATVAADSAGPPVERAGTQAADSTPTAVGVESAH